jgi:uncharacterized protein YraI
VAELLRVDGTMAVTATTSQAYMYAVDVTPSFNLTNGYANYAASVSVTPPSSNYTGSAIAHSVVGVLMNGQPTRINGSECAVGFGINVPNQNTAACNNVYGFYQGSGATYNYFASPTGIGTVTPAAMLQVVGDIRVGTSGTNGCLQNFAGTAIAGTCSSDLRLKTNIAPFEPVLEKLVQLQPVHFDWRAAEYPEYQFGAARNSGLIAQDVEKVFPGLVAVDQLGFKMVNYSELPYLMLQAIRELKAQNDSLASADAEKDAQIQTLTQQVRDLQKLQQDLADVESRLAKIESRAK